MLYIIIIYLIYIAHLISKILVIIVKQAILLNIIFAMLRINTLRVINKRNIATRAFSSTTNNLNNAILPYKFGGLQPKLFSECPSKLSQIYFEYFDKQKLNDYLSESYRDLLKALSSGNKARTELLVESRLQQKLFKQQKQIKKYFSILNQNAQIQHKICEQKIIIGTSSDRNSHKQNLICVANFNQSRIKVYFGNNQQPNTKKLPCLIQTNILFKSAIKLIQKQGMQQQSGPDSGLDQQEEAKRQENQQIHMIQYEVEGNFDPQVLDIPEQFSKYKSSLSWYDMLGSKSQKMFIEFFMSIFGINKQVNGWRISDIDGCLNGNHPEIYAKSQFNQGQKGQN